MLSGCGPSRDEIQNALDMAKNGRNAVFGNSAVWIDETPDEEKLYEQKLHFAVGIRKMNQKGWKHCQEELVELAGLVESTRKGILTPRAEVLKNRARADELCGRIEARSTGLK